MTLRTGRLTATQRLTPTSFGLELADGADVVRLSADVHGRVTVQRGAKHVSLSMRDDRAGEQDAVMALLAGSEAVGSFDRVMQTEWAGSAKAAQTFRSAHAVFAIVRGHNRPAVELAAAIATPKVSLVRIRRDDPDPCWTAYVNEVNGLTAELEACLDTWNPLQTAWCAYEFNFRATVAAATLVSCYL